MKPRRRLIAFSAAALLLGAPPVLAEPATYSFIAERSFVHFELLHFGTSTIRGRFGPLQGDVTLDRERGSGDLRLRIATASVSTGLPVFDARIRQPDLLNSASQPEAFFVATQWRFAGGQPTALRGEFTLRGTGRPLELLATAFACRRDEQTGAAGGGEVCGGRFEGSFERSEFGLSFGLPFVADRVRLIVLVEARRR